MPRLEIKVNGNVRTISLEGPTIRIGRQSDNDVVLDDKAASRQHCIIEQQDAGFVLKDLQSQNGTWVGENRVLEAILDFGESLRIGATLIRLLPDELENVRLETLPKARLVVEEHEEQPLPSAKGRVNVAATLAARNMVSGPLSKQLGPLMEACVNVPPPQDAPERDREVRLVNKKGEEVKIDEGGKTAPSEAILALRQLLFVAFRTRATDLHIEPKASVIGLRFRIDGQLHSVGEITPKMGHAILNVIKILCMIDIAKKSVVQEGNFAVMIPKRRVDFRVNMTPTNYGQKLALRFLDKGAVPDRFEELGMDEDEVQALTRAGEQDAGMVIIAGPTGSGKTTTLYTALQMVNAQTRNIITIEDPVEYELPLATQISIDSAHDLTFASVLSSVLRQDPDVILVGEIRDMETAKMAMQAATTGHLVLTTIHARDTTGVIFRLLDLGVEPFLIANSITMCISQRLVRVLCTHCKRPYRPDGATIRKMKLDSRPGQMLYESVGCKKCMEVGFRGRAALFEMLVFNEQLRDVVLKAPTIADIRKAAGEWLFRTLTDSGYKRVLEGITTVEEVDRVSGMI